MRIYPGIEALVGSTPLMELGRYRERHGLGARLLAKLEFMNPAGSAKDRVALGMIRDAEAKGLLNPGSTIIEPTSGNTGIGLAAMAAVLGYSCIIVMPDNMSIERQLLMGAHGAQLVLTPGAEGMKGAIARAKALAREIPGAFIPGQFENPANAKAHRDTTGPEIWSDTNGDVDIFVAGIGTGGTITGVAEYLKDRKKGVEIVGVEPAASPFLTKGQAGPHGIQGIGAGFAPGILRRELLDEIIPVSDEAAFEAGREFALAEGMLVGISSGAALCAAGDLAQRPQNRGKTIVVLFPDSGERYLSSPMYRE